MTNRGCLTPKLQLKGTRSSPATPGRRLSERGFEEQKPSELLLPQKGYNRRIRDLRAPFQVTSQVPPGTA